MRRNVLWILFMLAMVLAFSLGGFFNQKLIQVYDESSEFLSLQTQLPEFPESQSFTSTVIVPAVDQNGKGVPTIIEVTKIPGSGQSLLNVNNLLFMIDTQNSIRVSREVAADITGENISEYDIVYTVTANASVIEGPSAGAALSVATVAAIDEIELNKSVMITGTSNEQGLIGPVGGVLEKARAAKSIGAELFLVPPTQSVHTIYHTVNRCREVGFTKICGLETVPEKIYISENVGINIIEVRDIHTALEYFT